MIVLRLVTVMLCGLLLAQPVLAQTTPPAAPPAGLSQQQFDSLVDAISRSVADKLKAEGAAAPAAAPAPAQAPAPADASKAKSSKAPPPKAAVIVKPIEEVSDPFAYFFRRAGEILVALPVLGHYFGMMPGLLDQRAQGGRGPGTFLLLLGAVSIAAVLVEAALRTLLAGWRRRVAAGAVPQRGLQSLANLSGLILLDALGVVAVWLICRAALGVWFDGGVGQDRLASATLHGIIDWRMSVLLFRVILQPDMAEARLCAAGDLEARTMYLRISAVMLLLILGKILYQVLVAIGTLAEARAAYRLLSPILYVAAFLWLVFGARDAARQWFGGLGTVAPVIGKLGQIWVPAATTFFVALGLTQAFAVVSGRLNVAEAMALTLELVVGVLIFETLMQAVVRRLDSQLEGRTPAGNMPRLPDVAARCVRVAVLIGATVAIVQTWVVEVFALASENEWERITASSRTAAITLFLGFVLWELFKYATEPYMERRSKDPAQAIADGDATGNPASRISTLMPLLRVVGGIVILLIAVMIALEDFGVNITPLIAGASVFGIAISFGSQTLVRDIVSGIFYLTDDAFRVGEYIDCGKAKGTVEGFTLRSIKLRHQNGQVHTIPFGQLGQITNFSRDWITVKFNLRFARDTDIEKLRKVSKKIGTDMLELPEIKAEVLAPFKMQGVADILENALIVRFKFTARPGNPASIQREAIKRMFKVFPENGIEFAKEGAAVVLQTVSSGDGASTPTMPTPEPAKAAS